jgi:alpha-mannosidase
METTLKIETRIQLAEERFILPLLHPESVPLSLAMREIAGEPVTPDEALGMSFEPVLEGDAWGFEWGTAWLQVDARIPTAWAGKEVVALLDLGFEEEEGFGREAMVWRDGIPSIALSRHRTSIPIARPAAGGEAVRFHVEAAANPKVEWHWHVERPRPKDGRLYQITTARLATFNRETFELLLDFRVCREAMCELPEAGTRRARLRRGLDEVCRMMERDDPAWVAAARARLAPLLAARNGDTCHSIIATGHAHIDTAWCWPLRETIRKCARTFATALASMEDHPDYRFSASQPVQYLWMKHHYPSIYEGIRRAVARGQWEPMGAMWVEPDCNVPSGESLVRQLVHGQEFFRREFGVENRTLWLPDVFGYSAALPQILQKAGVSRFLTQKISWNDTNRFPHHTFLWEGIDGSRVFSHFPPVDTYNARVEARELTRAESQFAQKDRASLSLMPYGHGDGGGGPTVEMLGRIRRFEDFEGMPKVRFGTVEGFFDEAEADITDPPVWRGELYLELHRGTCTSQAHNKWMNRRCEQLLREAEFFDAITSVLVPGELVDADPAPSHDPWDVAGHPPAKDASPTARALDRAWKLLLLNQFHDILPGSSIQRVYEESRRDYEKIETLASAVREAGMARLLTGGSTGTTVFNTLAHRRREVIDRDGAPQWVEVPSAGYQTGISPDLPGDVAPVTLTASDGGWTLENGIVSLALDAGGRLVSVRSVPSGRECLSAPANEFHLLRDYPNHWSAWDIEASAMEDFEILAGAVRVSVIEDGPLRAVLGLERSFGSSRIRQRLVVRAGTARIDFETEIDWRERDRVLKVAFPLALRTDHSIAEIQFGHLRRPTHRNTSWDAARFEVPVHRWIDLHEPDFGVALLNDGIFGADVLDSRVRLTLLKSASAPDPAADLGVHRRVFSLFPHAGGPLEGRVIEEAAALNAPLLVRQGCPAAASESWFSCDRAGITLEALKRSEDGRAIVARWLEAGGRSCPGVFSTTLPLGNPAECDLHERPTGPASECLDFRPFDLRTIRWESGCMRER